MKVNPKSLKNLKPPEYRFGEPKRQRSVAVTDTGWQEFKNLASELNLSISDLIEKLARKELKIK